MHNLNIEVGNHPLPEDHITQALLAINCLLTAENPYDEAHAEKWLLLYEAGMIEQGRLLVPPGVLIAQLRLEAYED